MAFVTGFKTNNNPRVLVNLLNQAPDPSNIARVGDIWVQVNLIPGLPGTSVMFVCTAETATTSTWSQIP